MMKNEVKEFLEQLFQNADPLDYSSMLNYKLQKMISIDEGVITRPYTDTRGKITIGIGRNLIDNPLNYNEIHFLLQNDLVKANEQCTNVLINNWYQLSIIRRFAFINMIFNLGLTRFLRFKKMIAALEQKNYILAAAEIRDSKYWRDNDTHARAERIAKMIETDKMDPYYENY